MQSLSIFMQSSGIPAGGNVWIFVGIAVAACVFGVEVACIGILIRKLLHARKLKKIRDEQEAQDGYINCAAVFLSAAAIPLSAESVLSVLAILAAVAAVVFLILLIVFRACGYDYVASELLRDLQAERGDRQTAPAVPPAEEPAAGPEPAAEDGAEDEPAPLELPEEESEPESEQEWEQAPAQEPDEPADGDEPVPQEPAAAAFAASETPPASGMSPVGAPPPFTGSGGPVRIVQYEKQVTETVKEVQNPAPAAPAAAPAAKGDTSADRLIEKLSTLIDKIDQRQDGSSDSRPADSVAVSAGAPVPGEEDEEDEDELEEDAAETRDEDDVDDEPDDPEHFTGNERIIGFDEETGCYIVAHYRKSFEAKLIQARPNIKQYYSELKNALLAYKGTKSRISWGADSFHNGRTPIAKINVKTRILELYLALDPASLEGTVYRGSDVGHLKKYTDTPFRYKLRTPRKFKWAMELVERVCEEQGLSPIDAEKVDYEAAYPFEDTDSLVSRGLIKEYIREEKPASTFELDETHVPAVPEVDETVIPANANVSWEFDNELLSQKPPEPAPEPEPAPAPAPDEPADPEPEPAQEEPAVSGTVIRETTKVTQMRYTEQYYGVPDAPPAYKPGEEPFISNAFFETEPETVKSEPTKSGQEDEAGTQQAEEIPETEHADDESDAFSKEADGPAATEDKPADAAESDEPEEEESGLLSAFEEDAKQTDEDDLDWGIPASLTSLAAQTPVDWKGTGSVSNAWGSEPEAQILADGHDQTDEPDGADPGGYVSEDAEDAGPGAELLYGSEETAAEDADDGSADLDGQADVYDESDGYADADSDGGELDESAGETAYEEPDEYAEDVSAYDEPVGDRGEEAAAEEVEYDRDSAYGEDGAYDGGSEDYDESAESGEYTDADSDAGFYEGGDADDTPEYSDDYESAEPAAEPEPVPAPKSQVNPNVALVDVSVLETNFPYGSVINLDALKAKGLVLPTAKVLKIFATGELSKAFTVEADQFSLDAIRAIDSAGGEILMVAKK